MNLSHFTLTSASGSPTFSIVLCLRIACRRRQEKFSPTQKINTIFCIILSVICCLGIPSMDRFFIEGGLIEESNIEVRSEKLKNIASNDYILENLDPTTKYHIVHDNDHAHHLSNHSLKSEIRSERILEVGLIPEKESKSINPLMKKYVSEKYIDSLYHHIDDGEYGSKTMLESSKCLGKDCLYSIVYHYNNRHLHETLQDYISTIYDKLSKEDGDFGDQESYRVQLDARDLLPNSNYFKNRSILYDDDGNLYINYDFVHNIMIDDKITNIYWNREDNLWEIAKEARKNFDLETYKFPSCKNPERFDFCIDDHLVTTLSRIENLKELKRRDTIMKRYERIFRDYLPSYRYLYKYNRCSNLNRTHISSLEDNGEVWDMQSILLYRDVNTTKIEGISSNDIKANLFTKSIFFCESNLNVENDLSIANQLDKNLDHLHSIQVAVELNIEDYFLHFVDFDISNELWKFDEFYQGSKGLFTYQDDLNFLKGTLLHVREYIPVAIESLRQIIFKNPLFIPSTYLYTNLIWHIAFEDVRELYGVGVSNEAKKSKGIFFHDLDNTDENNGYYLYNFVRNNELSEDKKLGYLSQTIERHLNFTLVDRDGKSDSVLSYDTPLYLYQQLEFLDKSKEFRRDTTANMVTEKSDFQSNTKEKENKESTERDTYLNPNNVIIVTVATEDRPNLQLLKASIEGAGYNLTVIGRDRGRYIGHTTKLFIVQEFLQNLLKNNADQNSESPLNLEDKVFLFVDAYDVLFLPTFGSTLNRIFTKMEDANNQILNSYSERRFQKSQYNSSCMYDEVLTSCSKSQNHQLPVIFGAEVLCTPDPSLHLLYKRYADIIYPSPDRFGVSFPLMPKSDFPPAEKDLKYLNSGTYAGKVRDVMTMIDNVCDDLEYYYGQHGADVEDDGDQRWMIRYMFHRPGSILLDKYSTLFRCLHSTDPIKDYEYSFEYGLRVRKSNSSPAVIHGNGGAYKEIFPLIEVTGWPQRK